MLSPYRSATTYAYLLWLYLAHTSKSPFARSLHNRPPFHWVPLASSFVSPFSLTASYLVHFPYFSSSSPNLATSASLSTTPPYALSFPFLSISFPSHSFGCIDIYLSWHLLIHLFILRLIGSHCLLTFPRSSTCSSHSYWSIARLSLFTNRTV